MGSIVTRFSKGFVCSSNTEMDQILRYLFVCLGQTGEKYRDVSGAKKVAITRESGFWLYCLALGLFSWLLLVNPRKYTSFSFKVLIQGMNV